MHIVKARAVKVSVGANGGNRIAHVLREGDTVPEGVDEKLLAALTERGLIEPAAEEPESEEAEEAEAEGMAAEAGESEAPSDAWTVERIDAYAEEHGIDLSGVKKKDEKLAVITAASSAE